MPQINERLSAVESWLAAAQLRQEVRQQLALLADTERLGARLALNQGAPPHLIQLQQSLNIMLTLQPLLATHQDPFTQTLAQAFSPELTHTAQLIERTIEPDATIDPKSGGVIRAGVDAHLDELRQIVHHSQEWIRSLEKTERQRTGIASLKVRSNKVFGFYIEVTHTHREKVPDNYERKQTLVNSERYITPKLKTYEEKLLTAAEEANDLEYAIFQQVVAEVVQHLNAIQTASQAVATLDCLLSLATIAERHHYCRPQLTDQGAIHIQQGRHPVVEQLLPERSFVPNDVTLDTAQDQLHILTGPNMAGKSVYMRQVALIVLLAHIGSFVPAEKAEICLVDRIFVRSGAADMITAGLSTFMVEMVETAYILHHATPRSLIIMDEIGRGTSTYDGISLAWAIAAHLVTDPQTKAKTLFATHYHELQALAEEFPQSMKNFHLAIEEKDGEPIFLYTLRPGGASHSYGLEVAQLAGLPAEVISQAKKLLQTLKERQTPLELTPESAPPATDPTTHDDTKNQLVATLQTLDVSRLTPLEALNLLAAWKTTVEDPSGTSTSRPTS